MDLHLHLDPLIRHGTEPIAGWLEPTPGERLPFIGYLEFLALIERVLAADPGDAQAAPSS